MIRVLFWLVIGVLAYAALRKLGGGGGPARRPGPDGGGGAQAEDMVRCRACGLNLPKSEAIAVGREWACCAQHARDAGPGGPA